MSSNASYRRVAATESEADDASIRPNERRSAGERVTDKLVAALWVVVALMVAYFTSFFHVLYASNKAHRGLLQLATVCFAIDGALLAYLTVYLPRCKGLTDSSAWEVYCPKVLPSMGVTTLIGAAFLVRGTWPVWGFLSPLILGVEALGLLFGLHFVPWPF